MRMGSAYGYSSGLSERYSQYNPKRENTGEIDVNSKRYQFSRIVNGLCYANFWDKN